MLQGKLQNGLGRWRHDSSRSLAHTPSLKAHTTGYIYLSCSLITIMLECSPLVCLIKRNYGLAILLHGLDCVIVTARERLVGIKIVWAFRLEV